MALEASVPIGDGVDRVRSEAGLALLIALSVLALVRRVALHDLLQAWVAWTMDRIAVIDPGLAADLRPVEDAVQARLALAIGLDPVAAAALWLAAALAVVPIVVLAVAAFAGDDHSLRSLPPAGLLRKSGSLLVVGAAVGVTAAIGFSLVVVPGIAVLVAAVYVPPAIALEGDGPITAMGRSLRIVRTDVTTAVLLVIVALVGTAVAEAAAALLWIVLPAATGAILGALLQSVVWLVVLALVTSSYREAADELARPADGVGAATPPST